MPQKTFPNPAWSHAAQQRRVVAQPDAHLGVELERIVALPLPVDDPVLEGPEDVLLVADEVVVHHHDRPAPPDVVQRVELLDHPAPRLEAGRPAVERRDVAEGAALRTAAGDLDQHGAVVPDVDEVPPGERRLGEAPKPGAAVDDLATGGRGVGRVREHALENIHEAVLRLAAEEDRVAAELVAILRGQRASAEDGHVARVAAGNHRLEGVPVDDHGRGQDDVGPLEVVVCEGHHVHVDEAQVVVGGHHAGDGQQPEGRKGGLLVDDLERLLEAPEGAGLLRVDQQGLRHVTAPFRNRRAAATEVSDECP